MWKRIRAFVRRQPALSYFVATFAISWSGILALILVGPTGWMATQEQFERLLPFWVPMLVLGPSLAGVLMTWLAGGRPGLRAYRARLFRWRVDARWYAIALLLAPLYFTLCCLALALFDPAFLPALFTTDDRAGLVIRGMMVALMAGVFEELGWTGFATPTLRRRHGPVTTGVIVGALWGLWHFLPKIWGSDAHGLVPYMAQDLTLAIVGLTGFRILMVWVYDRTESLLIGILMHTGLTAATLILQPLLLGAPLLWVGVATTAAGWGIVAAVVLARHRRGSGTTTTTARGPMIATPRPAH